MTSVATVTVEKVDGYHILLMRWKQQVNPHDVTSAFRQITTSLNNTEHYTHIIVDLRQNPRFPIQTTISETLAGPFRHSQMGKWLVIGSNRMAKIIANVLTKMNEQSSIVWFEDEVTLWEYVATLDQAKTRAS